MSEYGIRLSRELVDGGMKWPEFAALLGGIGPDSALGRVIAIRSETDPERLKQFTPSQKKIRDDWIMKQANEVKERTRRGEAPGADVEKALREIQNIFASM